MAYYGWQDLRLKAKNGTGGTWTDIKSWVDEQDMPKLKALFEVWHPKGAEWGEKVKVGTKDWDGQTSFGGLFNPAASNVDEFFYDDAANLGNTFHIAESFDGGTNWFVFRALLIDYARPPKQGGLTRYKVTLEPFGSPLHTATEPTSTTVPSYP
jgi:hypothetical protein